MTRFFYDCEFLEDGKTIELISIGIVSSDDREYYAVNLDLPVKRIRKHRWLMDNVVPTLPKPSGDWNNHMPRKWLFDYNSPLVKHKERIAAEVVEFIRPQKGKNTELWAYYGAYDHVVLCQLFGTMMNLPDGMPMFTHDLMQAWETAGRPPKPEQGEGQHNALEDARWNAKLFASLTARAEREAQA